MKIIYELESVDELLDLIEESNTPAPVIVENEPRPRRTPGHRKWHEAPRFTGSLLFSRVESGTEVDDDGEEVTIYSIEATIIGDTAYRITVRAKDLMACMAKRLNVPVTGLDAFYPGRTAKV